MSPLDDELRALLRSRADTLTPASDPLVGVEKRATKMRRTRVASSVAAAALAVGAIAVAVPSLMPHRAQRTEQVATTPTPSPASTPSPSPVAVDDSALDPAHPWDYRGDRSVVADVSTLQSEWSTVHPGAVLTPLYGEVYGSSQKPQITFVSSGGGQARWGVATSSEAGWTFLHDAVLATGTKVLMAALPADEVPRLLVVAAPTTGRLEYAKDGSTFTPIAGALPGVGYVPLQGDTSRDVVRVLDGNGDIGHPVFQGPAPDAAAPTSGNSARPTNALDWQTRGTVDTRLESQAVSAYAQARGTQDAVVGHQVLWGGTDSAGRSLLLMQAWVGAGPAQTFGMVSTGERFLGPVIGKNPPLLAYLAAGAPGSSADVLVLLPRPGAGPFSYASSAAAPYRQVGNARSDLQNVAITYRDPKATSDRVQVLDGDGMHVLYDGPVQKLLCGATSCG